MNAVVDSAQSVLAQLQARLGAAVITDPGGIGIDAHRSPANWVIQDERPICGGSIFFHVVVLGQ